jgi:hypothetical protein
LSEEPRPASFSNVALTLISLVIALGIEHLLEQVTARSSGANVATVSLIVAQGTATFLTIVGIWISYATQLMTAAWKPAFQDFLNPLLILTILYFWISTIGDSGPAWFYFSTVGSAIALYGHRFDLPKVVALRLGPSSVAARPFFITQLSILLLATGGGIASQVGALDTLPATILISLIAVDQLLCAWFHVKWWRST